MKKNIAVDIGSGFTKFTNELKPNSCYSFQSVVTPYSEADSSSNDFWVDKSYIIEFDNNKFLVGKSAIAFGKPIKRVDTINEDWHGEDGWRALLYKAISETFDPEDFDEDEVLNLIVGIPQKIFSEKKAKMDILLDGIHKFSVGNQSYHIKVNGYVIPQASAAVIYNSFKEPELLEGTVGVIDIGTCTTGLSVFDDGQPVFYRSSGMTVGMNDTYLSVINKIREDTGFIADEAKMPEYFSQGKIKLRSGDIELKPYIEYATDIISKTILEKAKSIWGVGTDNEIAQDIEIFLTGGGTKYFQSALEKYIPGLKSSLGEDPFYDVVLGMYTYMQSKED